MIRVRRNFPLSADAQIGLLVELPADNRPGPGRHIAGNPAAAGALGGYRHISAAGKAVQDNAALGTAGLDNAPGQGLGFLRRIADIFPAGRRIDVVPQAAGGRAAPIVRVLAALQFPAGQNDNVALAVLLLQTLLLQPPAAGMGIGKGITLLFPSIAEIGSSSHIWRTPNMGAVVVIAAAVCVDAIKFFQQLLLGQLAPGLHGGLPGFGVEQNGVQGIAPGFRFVLGTPLVRGVADPHNFVAEVALPKDGVHHLPQVAVGRIVAVQIDAAGRLENPLDLKHSLRHKSDVGGDAIVLGVADGAD